MNFNIYSPKEIRLLENDVFKAGISPFALMEKAGEVTFNFIKKQNFDLIIFFCGKGNNGGDAYCAASLLKKKLISCQCIIVEKPQTQESIQAYKKSYNAKVPFKKNLIFSNLTNKSILIVDALFGIGLTRELDKKYIQLIEEINKFIQKNKKSKVLSLDIPSGLSAKSGMPCPIAIKADWTMSFLAYKQGYFLGKAFDFCGEIILEELGVDKKIQKERKRSFSLLNHQILKELPERKKHSHKGDFGHLLIIGGNEGMLGAIIIAGLAASRMGLGKLSFLTLEKYCIPLMQKIPIAMTLNFPEIESNKSSNSKEELLLKFEKITNDKTTILIGPGLGSNFWAKEILSMVLNLQNKKKVILDADALNLVSKLKYKINKYCFLTPHPKEAARLLSSSVDKVQENRLKACQKLKKLGSPFVLKGRGSLIVGEKDIFICNLGNSGMASAGMGDLLAGMISGLVCQNVNFIKAACIGTYLHSYIGDLIAKEKGERGLLAIDFIPLIQTILNEKK